MYTVKIKGGEKLRGLLPTIPQKLRTQVMLPSVRAGARVIVRQAKAIVAQHDDPETGRQIGNNIQTRYRRKRSEQLKATIVSVGVMYPKGQIPKGNPDDGVNTPHWHLLELGTEKMAARPFLVPAAMMTANDVFQTIADQAERRISKLDL